MPHRRTSILSDGSFPTGTDWCTRLGIRSARSSRVSSTPRRPPSASFIRSPSRFMAVMASSAGSLARRSRATSSEPILRSCRSCSTCVVSVRRSSLSFFRTSHGTSWPRRPNEVRTRFRFSRRCFRSCMIHHSKKRLESSTRVPESQRNRRPANSIVIEPATEIDNHWTLGTRWACAYDLKSP
ncbi:MAG: hypothetical protein EWM72_00894 [Nitrospira sp.]|nr:MAG: hypothetical protein EWM72_00894 [Nitrospira sp.]